MPPILRLIWKQIPDFPNYYVSIRGQVKSFQYGKWSLLTPRLTAKRKTKNGKEKPRYRFVSLWKNNKEVQCRVHRLVAEAFIPKVDGKPWVDHRNRRSTDNRVINLRWVSPSENNYNMSKRSNATSQYFGVSWNTEKKKWRARVKNTHIGYYTNPITAAKAYNQHIITNKLPNILNEFALYQKATAEINSFAC